VKWEGRAPPTFRTFQLHPASRRCAFGRVEFGVAHALSTPRCRAHCRYVRHAWLRWCFTTNSERGRLPGLVPLHPVSGYSTDRARIALCVTMSSTRTSASSLTLLSLRRPAAAAAAGYFTPRPRRYSFAGVLVETWAMDAAGVMLIVSAASRDSAEPL